MSTGFEKKKRKTKTSFAASVDSFDITSKFQEYFTEVKDPRPGFLTREKKTPGLARLRIN